MGKGVGAAWAGTGKCADAERPGTGNRVSARGGKGGKGIVRVCRGAETVKCVGAGKAGKGKCVGPGWL